MKFVFMTRNTVLFLLLDSKKMNKKDSGEQERHFSNQEKGLQDII